MDTLHYTVQTMDTLHYTFQIIETLSRLQKHYTTLSRLQKHFLDYRNIYTTLSRLQKHFLDYRNITLHFLSTLWTHYTTLSRLQKHFLDCRNIDAGEHLLLHPHFNKCAQCSSFQRDHQIPWNNPRWEARTTTISREAQMRIYFQKIHKTKFFSSTLPSQTPSSHPTDWFGFTTIHETENLHCRTWTTERSQVALCPLSRIALTADLERRQAKRLSGTFSLVHFPVSLFRDEIPDHAEQNAKKKKRFLIPYVTVCCSAGAILDGYSGQSALL